MRFQASLAGFLIGVTSLASVLLIVMPDRAMSAPCDQVDEEGNCTGDQSDGIASGVDFESPPVTTLNVHSLSGDIRPVEGTEGISFRNVEGDGSGVITLNSGESQANIVIITEGNGAAGIVVESRGTPRPTIEIPFLGLLIPVGPGGSSDGVVVNSYSNITTEGDDSSGIVAQSRSGGLSDAEVEAIEAYLDEYDPNIGNPYAVVEVEGSDTNVGIGVGGDNGGTFTLNADGTYSVDLGTDFDDLEVGEERRTQVEYMVTGNAPGIIILNVTMTETGLTYEPSVSFQEFGLSSEDYAETHVLPDMVTFLRSQLTDVAVGGAGNDVSVTSAGTIETLGSFSHGIFAQSTSGDGEPGRNGSISHSADAGDPGQDGGTVTVTNNGSIVTSGPYSNGIAAVSQAGDGGRGGEGGTWRYGARGGTGGTGGDITISGSGSIHTLNDYSSGIIALSQGGDGGDGGDADFVTSGGSGGYGGVGGAVTVDASAFGSIRTEGVESYGIWAKSLGGNGGRGGTGGWLAGGGGGGGSASDGGEVTILNGGLIETLGSDSYGIYGQSVGGFGGSGASSFGLFYSYGGDGESAGSGGDVTITNQLTGVITTHGDRAHAIVAQSVGGGGGSGGSAGAVVGLGGEGAAGGDGGAVNVTNDGQIQTFGDNARGIYAQSIGGGGGDGGDSGGLVAIGGDGSGISNGGTVTVNNSGMITTAGERSHAIFAESIGGGGGSGGFSGGLVSIGGDGAGGGNAGVVTITNSGQLVTSGADASGIFAQSVGGGGGDGGGSASVGVGFAFAMGGNAEAGGDGAMVDVTSDGNAIITTGGDRSYGIFAQSVGGGGGSGGFGIAGSLGSIATLSFGGTGGGGGAGGEVEVDIDGTITTTGTDAHGIFAQSVGGGGGSGGFSIAGGVGGIGLKLSMGGGGGDGGNGNMVTVGTETPIQGEIITSGDRAYGILAQSIGGGGGDGGFSITGAAFSGPALNLAIGGSGGIGGAGGIVNVNSASDITTQGLDAHGIFAQSVGGGGGNGGFSVTGEYGGATSLAFAFGGDGGSGSMGNNVNVGTGLDPLQGKISTSGDRAYGILAQSIGGGGGDGGFSVTGRLLGGVSSQFSFGGDGGIGSIGGDVEVHSASDITTQGEGAHGILAQSIGGGGGSGGWSLGAAVTAFGGFELSMGGNGGIGNSGGIVDVYNSGAIETKGEYSHGIMAQSIGGGGGSGGSSGSAMVNFSSLIPIPEPYPSGSLNMAISLGGDAGIGGVADSVSVTNTGEITTREDFSYGVFAQSIGGGGGDGGRSIAATGNISAPIPGEPQLEVQVDFALAIGGDGGDGNNGGAVDVSNDGEIDTSGDSSHGIFAQSIGGGGGVGGNARAMTVSIDPINMIGPDELRDLINTGVNPLSFSKTVNISIGGDGGSGGDGSSVMIVNTGSITTRGADAYGIFAQSIGGGGGAGGGGYHGLDWADLGVPDDLIPVFEEFPLFQTISSVEDATITVGGDGGSSGNGGDIRIVNTGNITTLGDGSFGVLAQSIGGGGGTGGIGAVAEEGTTVSIGGGGGAAGDGGAVEVILSGNMDTSGIAAHGIVAQSIGGGGGIAGNINVGMSDFGISLDFAQEGGSSGNGGTVIVDITGDIITRGAGSNGIFAQSVGGGGGVAGNLDDGIGFAGSVGGSGSGDAVSVTHSGNITTLGDVSHGIVAQSAGGDGVGGAVDVTLAGDIIAQGANSDGIVAQSRGDSGSGNISVDISSSTVQGGSGSGAGVRFLEGADNTLLSYGTVTNLNGVAGTAIVGTTGNETIDNYGIVTGSVDLGAGSNAFNNWTDSLFNTGETVYLGSGNLLMNAGTLSSGGTENVQTTTLAGDLTQTGSGIFLIDLDVQSSVADRLNVSGTSDLAGSTDLIILNPGWATPGEEQIIILSSAGGVADSGLGLFYGPSVVFDAELLFPNFTDVVLDTSIDFSPHGLNHNQGAIGNCFNRILLAGGSESLAPYVAELFWMPDIPSLAFAYNQLSPQTYDHSTWTTFEITRQYAKAVRQRLHSIRYGSPAGGTSMQAKLSTVLLAYNGSDASIGSLLDAEEPPRKRYGAWLAGFGEFGDQDKDDDFSGFDYDMGGVAGGLDYGFTENLVAGISLEKAETDIDLDNDIGNAEIESLGLSIYGSYFTERMYLDAALSYARQSYDNVRHLEVGAISSTAHSDHDGDAYMTFAEAGYNFKSEKRIVQPFASLHYIYLDEESFGESGAGGASLRVEDRQTDSLVSELGVRAACVLEIDNADIIPEVAAAWSHDFDIDDRNITASFAGFPGSSFTIKSQDFDDDRLVVDAGLTFAHANGWSAEIKYNGNFSNDYKAHGVIGEIQYMF